MPHITDFPFRFGPAPCCCPGDCFVFEDDFGGSDSTIIGSDWNEVSGDWEILSGQLHEKIGGGGTSGARVFGTQGIPSASGGQMYIRVKIYDAEIGDVFSIFTCCETSSSVGTGIEVTFELTDTQEWTITIDPGGEDVSVVQTTASDDPEVYVCADHRVQQVTAGLIITTDEKAWADDLDPGEGTYYALGHGNVDNGAIFDDFYVIELSSGSMECTNCVCQCLNRGIKKQLTGEIIEVESWANGNDLEPCEGQTFTLTYDFDGVDGEAWYGRWTNSSNPPGAFYVDFILKCNGGWNNDLNWPGKNITLTFSVVTAYVCQTINDATCTAVVPIAEESSCDPLSLVYGWFYAQFDVMPPVDISRYKIRITEA